MSEITQQISEITGITVGYLGRDHSVNIDIYEQPLTAAVKKLGRSSIFFTRTVDGMEKITKIVLILDKNRADGIENKHLPAGRSVEAIAALEKKPTGPHDNKYLPAAGPTTNFSIQPKIVNGIAQPPQIDNLKEIPAALSESDVPREPTTVQVAPLAE